MMSVFLVCGTQFAKVCRPKISGRYDPEYTLKMVKHPDSPMVETEFMLIIKA